MPQDDRNHDRISVLVTLESATKFPSKTEV